MLTRMLDVLRMSSRSSSHPSSQAFTCLPAFLGVLYDATTLEDLHVASASASFMSFLWVARLDNALEHPNTLPTLNSPTVSLAQSAM